MKRHLIVIIEMAKDNSAHTGDCPKPKKSKQSEVEYVNWNCDWGLLPSVVIHEIFDLLNFKDRMNASSVCKHWRYNFYHPKWCQKVSFKIEPRDSGRSKYLMSAFGGMVSHATIKLNTLSSECMQEFITLLQILSENDNLKSIVLEPTHCQFDTLPISKIVDCNKEKQGVVPVIKNLIQICLPYLTSFSIGCIEDLCGNIREYLTGLGSRNPSLITLLGLASVKDDPNNYHISVIDPHLLKPFTNLKILSVDYDQLSDLFLTNLDDAKQLERLVVHLHVVRKDHPGTTDPGWVHFRNKHPHCQLRLTIIHAFNDIDSIHETVFKSQMPLTHLKVFFCENVNINVLEYMSSYYHETLISLMWIDSLSDNQKSWIFATPDYDDSPDPFILISWLCKKIQEIVLYGYKYYEDNLVAIARLRGPQLSKLEITKEDLLITNFSFKADKKIITEISQCMNRSWAPIKTQDLHPVICNPMTGDSDEFLLPIVLADLH